MQILQTGKAFIARQPQTAQTQAQLAQIAWAESLLAAFARDSRGASQPMGAGVLPDPLRAMLAGMRQAGGASLGRGPQAGGPGRGGASASAGAAAGEADIRVEDGGAVVALPTFKTARSSKSRRDPREVLLETSQKLQENPKDFQAMAERAEALNELGDHAAAEAEANRALALQPRLVRALLARALAYNRRGQFSLALQDSELVTAQEPNNALGHLYKAMALEGLGRVREALPEYELAAQLDPALGVFFQDAVARHGATVKTTASPQGAPSDHQPGSAWPLRDMVPVLLGIAVILALSRARGSSTPPAPAVSPAAVEPRGGKDRLLGGSYRLDSRLAEGGMGVVYLGTDVVLQRRVAIKQMRAEIKDSGADAELLLQEARVVAALRHPNIVEIHAVLQEAGEIYLVFEYVDGRPLDRLLSSRGRFALPEAVHLLAQAAAGLDCAHRRNVIHRDLKPGNILVSGEGVAKITDFGIAHRCRTSATRLTNVMPWGTPHYMPPEQEMGSVTAESDVYALGIVAYELLTGSLPFPGPDFRGQKLNKTFVPPSQAVPGLPAAVDEVFTRALEPTPGRRFPSGAELVGALARALPVPAPAARAV